MTLPDGKSIGGTVSVDQQGRVRELAATRVLSAPKAPLWLTITSDITFSDFGVPVSVQAPPASQVYTGP